MAFLRINNYEVPVADGQASEKTEPIGESGRAFDGSALSTARAFKRTWQFKTTPVDVPTYSILRGLLLGYGHSWGFEDTTDWGYSSKGLPIASGESNGTHQATGGFLDTDWLKITTDHQITWDLVEVGTSWSIMVWAYSYQLGDVGWHHWIVCSDGTKYKDGAVTTDTIDWLALSGTTLTLGSTASLGLYQKFDDLVYVPYLVSSAMALAFGDGTQVFSELPRLTMTGGIVGSESVSVECYAVSASIVQYMSGGAWVRAGRVVTFELAEV